MLDSTTLLYTIAALAVGLGVRFTFLRKQDSSSPSMDMGGMADMNMDKFRDMNKPPIVEECDFYGTLPFRRLRLLSFVNRRHHRPLRIDPDRSRARAALQSGPM